MTQIPKALLRARERWKYTGAKRPDFATAPGPDQESVWDYPRPPRMERDSRLVTVRYADISIAETRRAIRILETASPPTFYVPREDVRVECLERSERRTICEWKGHAVYWSLRLGETFLEDVAWSYPEPFDGYESLVDYFSFYPARLDCTVDGERVRPQASGFYGGWVTGELVGPFKGEPGTEDW